MVSSLRDKSVYSTSGLPYLRPVEPEIIDVEIIDDAEPRKLPGWLKVAGGALYAGAIALAAWLPGTVQPPVVEPEPVSDGAALIETLASPEFLQFQANYRAEAAEAARQAAEADREAAERDRLYAEQQALAASYKRVDELLGYQPGEEIKSTTRVNVACETDEFGERAIVRQIDGEYKDGVLNNLAQCFPGELSPGGVIGIAGDHTVGLENY